MYWAKNECSPPLDKVNTLVRIPWVMRAAPGPARDEAIDRWSASVWAAWSEQHERVAAWVKEELKIEYLLSPAVLGRSKGKKANGHIRNHQEGKLKENSHQSSRASGIRTHMRFTPQGG